jgi:hypothetical protein
VIDPFFRLSANRTTIRAEVLAGATTGRPREAGRSMTALTVLFIAKYAFL